MPVLVDTSVWVQHFRAAVPELVALAAAGEVVTHSVVVGELAVGGLPNRPQTLADLRNLIRVEECTPDDALDFLERHRLFGLGLSWGDVQLLAAADLNGVPLWTLDKRLDEQARALCLAWPP
mgnify:CR=1 FL=1